MKHSMKRLWLEENKLTQQKSPQVYQICKQMTIINGEISLVQIIQQTMVKFNSPNFSTNDNS